MSPADVRGGINNSRSAVAKAGGSVVFTLCLLKLTNAPPHFDEGAFRLTDLTNPVCRHTEVPFGSTSALCRRFAQAGRHQTPVLQSLESRVDGCERNGSTRRLFDFCRDRHAVGLFFFQPQEGQEHQQIEASEMVSHTICSSIWNKFSRRQIGVIDLPAEGVRQAGEPPHRHPHREVLTLYAAGRDALRIAHIEGIRLPRRRPGRRMPSQTTSRRTRCR